MHRSVFSQFYGLSARDILVLFSVATWIFLRLHERLRSCWLWKLFMIVVFAGFAAVILHLTVSSRDVVSTNMLLLIPFHSYREVLNGGNPEIYRSNFMNAVLFYPAGLLTTSLLPDKWPGWGKCILVTFLFAALSIGIEYVQYAYSLGRCEIDDVIHNTAGALAGSLAALLIPPLFVWVADKTKLMWEQYDHYRK